MGRTIARTWPVVTLLVLLAMVQAACAQESGTTVTQTPVATHTPAPTYTVHMLIETAPDKVQWYRDVQVSQGYDAYQLTELVTKGDLKATWYPAYRSHFVESLLGVKNEGSKYWLIYLWDESSSKWTPLPVGADWFSLKDGHTLAWAYTDTSQNPSSPPSQTP